MATRARIGILTKGKNARLIHVAYEGSPNYTGVLLKTHYNTTKRVKELLQKGNIVQVEERLEAIETDQILTTTETIRFVSSASDLSSEVLVDYTYIFKEEDKTWYLVDEGQFKKIYI